MTSCRAAVALLSAVAAGCARAAPLECVAHDFGPASGARLNQPLVLTFNQSVDPGSVRAETIRVARAGDGAVVAGAFQTDGAVVTFTPRNACAPDLADGGLRPGERCRVEVPGLPRLACLRSADGALLEHGAVLEFATVAATPDAPAGELFLDDRPGVAPQFEPSTEFADLRARVRFSKPLDPRTVPKTRFYFKGPWTVSAHETDDPVFHARLVENDGAAVVELVFEGAPPLPIDPRADYWVNFERSPLRDYSGESPVTEKKGTEPFVRLVLRKKEKP